MANVADDQAKVAELESELKAAEAAETADERVAELAAESPVRLSLVGPWYLSHFFVPTSAGTLEVDKKGILVSESVAEEARAAAARSSVSLRIGN